MTDEIASIRPITRADLVRLATPRDKSLTVVKRLRDSHRDVARFLALGHSYPQIAALTGYSPNRIGQLANSPAMQELVAQFRGRMDEIWEEAYDAYARFATRNMLAAERQIADRLEEADASDETLPIRELVAITSDRADRFGYPKKAVNTNVNVDFAAKLEAAIQRSGKAGGQPPRLVGSGPSSGLPHPTPPLRRIA